MSSKLVVAISAYNKPKCLDDLVQNVRRCLDAEEIIVYDCSPAQDLTDGLDVARCPTSRPLRWGHLTEFFIEVMRWLEERKFSYDYLVTLHSDMLLIRKGLASYLDINMADSEYMAPGYLRTDEWCESRIPPLRHFHHGWPLVWGPLFGIDAPSWAYSPGQIFRTSYAEKAFRFPNIDRLVKRAYRSKLLGIEEVFYATLADAMGCNPMRMPEEHGCHQAIVTVPKLRGYLEMPTVYFVHKVAMEESDPVRLAMQDVREGRSSPLFDVADVDAEPWPLDPELRSETLLARLKDLYFHFQP